MATHSSILAWRSPWTEEPGRLQSMGSQRVGHNCAIIIHSCYIMGFPGGTSGKEPACQCRRCKRHGFDPWVRKIPWRRVWLPTPIFLPREFHEQRSLTGYSPWGRKESDTTEWVTLTLYWGRRHKILWNGQKSYLCSPCKDLLKSFIFLFLKLCFMSWKLFAISRWLQIL